MQNKKPRYCETPYISRAFKMPIKNCEQVKKELITVFHEAKSTECEQTKPSIRGAVMRHTNGRYKERNKAQTGLK